MDLAVVIWVICAIANVFIAGNKGRSQVGWLLMGFFFGLIGTIVLLLLPPLKKCPHCKGSVPQDAKVCKHCGRELFVAVEQ